MPFVNLDSNWTGQVTEEISTPNKTCRRCHNNDERPKGTNTTNWMGRWWNLKVKLIPILILTEIFPSVYETWYLKTFIKTSSEKLMDSKEVSWSIVSTFKSKSRDFYRCFDLIELWVSCKLSFGMFASDLFWLVFPWGQNISTIHIFIFNYHKSLCCSLLTAFFFYPYFHDIHTSVLSLPTRFFRNILNFDISSLYINLQLNIITLSSFDINNLCTNIPISETLKNSLYIC